MDAKKRSSRDNRSTGREALQAYLLDMAWELVRRDGVALFTVRRLAAEAGVAVGLPHAYFGTREGLLDELRVRAWDRLEADLKSRFGSEPDPETAAEREQVVRKLMRAIVDYAVAQPNTFGLLLLVPGMEMSERVLARELEAANPLLSILLRGVERGHFHFDDPLASALSLWTAIHGHVQRMSGIVTPVYREVQERVLERLLDMFFAVARAHPPQPSRDGG